MIFRYKKGNELQCLKNMIDYHKLAIPAIAILAAGGIISFLLAYNLYPEKHVNVNIGGKCYELLDSAYKKYQDLAAKNEIEILRLQLDAIDTEQATLPVTFSGRQSDILNFKNKYGINITSDNAISDDTGVDKRIVKATVTKNELKKIVDDLSVKDLIPLSKTAAGSIGLQPNVYMTPEEGKIISLKSTQFLRKGIQEIINSKEGVKPAECRSTVPY
jgi:hypothetical protein